MGYSINGVTKVITLTSGTTTVSVRDLWSRWVDWSALSDNSKFLPAMETVGGNDVDAANGTSIPIYAFLVNDWRIKPQEASHTLVINDGILLVDGGGDPFNNTTGSYIVRINYQQPVQAITVATGGVDPSAVAAAVGARVVEGAMTADELLRILVAVMAGKSSGGGTSTVTFRNMADSVDRIVATVDGNGNRTAVTRDPN